MKRIAVRILLFVILLLLCGGILFFRFRGGLEAPASPAREAAPSALAREEQLRILEDNRALWAFTEPWDSPWYYTFTDLDRNGRMEVVAAVTEGTGIFTYARFWEVSADGSGIVECWQPDPGIEGPDDWPEIIRDSLPCYCDRAADRYYYVCENVTKNGAAYQFCQLCALCLKDGSAEWETLASKSMEWNAEGAGPLVQCWDGQGDPIGEQDYDSAVERRFAGLEQSVLPLAWTEVENPWPEETGA